ncbi:transcription repressor OFP13-like [Vigna radiata var. radiata]|uniref:Transcription repressor n=1 Tax=Vigna radiata var. radiata TaxID=3916 RepID=A0A1S3TP12_VIGRR|nr:transcription repressor OFP13-like [Vigna radiata var. radiata]
MGKKMKLPSLLHKNSHPKPSSTSWPWPSCHQPRTLSFRDQNDVSFKTINPAYFDMPESSHSFFTVSPDSGSFSTASEEDSRRPDSLETLIRPLPSDRLFFHPDQTSSILESKAGTSTPTPTQATTTPTPPTTTTTTLPFKDSVVMSVESQDPYVDFLRSMEEMVEAQCVKDFDGLQELLCWYLKVNGKSNHGYIVGAFIDLLVAFSDINSHSPSSPLSFYSSSLSSSCSTHCVSCLEAEDEVDTATPNSSFLLEQVREDQSSSSSSSSLN